MTRDQQRLADYLSHILEAIERIDRYTEDMDEHGLLEQPIARSSRFNVRIGSSKGRCAHNAPPLR